jgi:hypothetical protein
MEQRKETEPEGFQESNAPGATQVSDFAESVFFDDYQPCAQTFYSSVA